MYVTSNFYFHRASEEFEKLKRSTDQELTKMGALLKKAEMKIISFKRVTCYPIRLYVNLIHLNSRGVGVGPALVSLLNLYFFLFVIFENISFVTIE